MQNGLNGNRVEIVLVEDNDDDVTMTLNVLRKGNIRNEVHVIKDGTEALDYILRTGKHSQRQLSQATQLILLDLNLPKVHGLDVLRKIKTDERTKAYPVIILTSSQEERGVMQSYKLGAQGCIVKPFDLSKFTEAVAELHLNWVLVDKLEG
jgi:two-component system response regulator